MKRSRRVSTAAAVLAAGVLAAGCGNSEQNDYVDELNALQTELRDDVTALDPAEAASGPEGVVEIAKGVEDAFTTMADGLEAVTPPEEVADLHAQLVQQVRDVADGLAQTVDAFTSGNAQEAQQAAAELTTAIPQAQTQLNSLIDQINAEFGN